MNDILDGLNLDKLNIKDLTILLEILDKIDNNNNNSNDIEVI